MSESKTERMWDPWNSYAKSIVGGIEEALKLFQSEPTLKHAKNLHEALNEPGGTFLHQFIGEEISDRSDDNDNTLKLAGLFDAIIESSKMLEEQAPDFNSYNFYWGSDGVDIVSREKYQAIKRTKNFISNFINIDSPWAGQTHEGWEWVVDIAKQMKSENGDILFEVVNQSLLKRVKVLWNDWNKTLGEWDKKNVIFDREKKMNELTQQQQQLRLYNEFKRFDETLKSFDEASQRQFVSLPWFTQSGEAAEEEKERDHFLTMNLDGADWKKVHFPYRREQFDFQNMINFPEKASFIEGVGNLLVQNDQEDIDIATRRFIVYLEAIPALREKIDIVAKVSTVEQVIPLIENDIVQKDELVPLLEKFKDNKYAEKAEIVSAAWDKSLLDSNKLPEILDQFKQQDAKRDILLGLIDKGMMLTEDTKLSNLILNNKDRLQVITSAIAQQHVNAETIESLLKDFDNPLYNDNAQILKAALENEHLNFNQLEYKDKIPLLHGYLVVLNELENLDPPIAKEEIEGLQLHLLENFDPTPLLYDVEVLNLFLKQGGDAVRNRLVPALIKAFKYVGGNERVALLDHLTREEILANDAIKTWIMRPTTSIDEVDLTPEVQQVVTDLKQYASMKGNNFSSFAQIGSVKSFFGLIKDDFTPAFEQVLRAKEAEEAPIHEKIDFCRQVLDALQNKDKTKVNELLEKVVQNHPKPGGTTHKYIQELMQKYEEQASQAWSNVSGQQK